MHQLDGVTLCNLKQPGIAVTVGIEHKYSQLFDYVATIFGMMLNFLDLGQQRDLRLSNWFDLLTRLTFQVTAMFIG